MSHSKVHFLCALYKPGEWLWVDSNGTYGKPTFGRRAIPRFVFISEKWRPEVGSRWRCSSKSWRFWKKTPYGQIFKNVFQKDSWWHRSTFCVQISWNMAYRKSVKSCIIYVTKKTISACSPALASAWIAPKICHGQLHTIYSECPQISSKSVHFRRSYSWTREHRWNAPQSVSNTRRSFFAE